MTSFSTNKPRRVAVRFSDDSLRTRVLLLVSAMIVESVLPSSKCHTIMSPTVPNSDGTVSFLPSADIFLAALIVLLIVMAALAIYLAATKRKTA